MPHFNLILLFPLISFSGSSVSSTDWARNAALLPNFDFLVGSKLFADLDLILASIWAFSVSLIELNRWMRIGLFASCATRNTHVGSR